MTAHTSATEPGWLRQSITRLFAIVGLFLFPGAVGVAWPLDAVGNAYQLLGVFIAALGVPVVEPWLMQRERELDGSAREAMRFMRVRRAAWREWWRRRRGGPQTATVDAAVELSAAGAIATAGGRAELTVKRTVEAEIAVLKQELESLTKARAEDAADFKRQLAAQREELETHAVRVTERGWQYIVCGAACSAFGTFLALVA
jgi:hypothetical protein